MAANPPNTPTDQQGWKEGAGPGGEYVPWRKVVELLLVLVLATILFLVAIAYLWPACDQPCDTSRAPGVADTRGNQNGNENADQNANQGGNQNANVNAGGNTNAGQNSNQNGNAGGGQGGNQNGNLNSNPSPGRPAGTPAPGTAANPAAGAAKLDADTVSPNSGPLTGGNQVTIKGKNFLPPGGSTAGLAVSFGGKPAGIISAGSESLSVSVPSHCAGTVDVVVRRGDRADEQDTLSSQYTYVCPGPSGANLFWMVVFAGALGGALHSLRSFYWYVGNRDLTWSWVPMYLLLPFTGACIAVVFYLIAAAGLLPGVALSGGTTLIVVAVAALVGLFSQQAAVKLKEIFEAILARPEPGARARPQGTLPSGEGGAGTTGGAAAKLSSDKGKAGDDVRITGPNMATAASVTFGGTAATPLTPDPATSSVAFKVPALPQGATPGPVEVLAKDAAGKTLAKLTFTYTS